VIVEEPVRGRHAFVERPELFGLSGLDQLRIWTERRVPAPPVHHLTGLVATAAEPEASTWEMPATAWWRSAAGVVPGGALAFVADGALAGAVYTVLPKAVAAVTSELSIHFVRPAAADGGPIVARGRLIHAGRRQGLAEARIEDGTGRLLAHATERCLLRPLGFEPPDATPGAFAFDQATEEPTPDPFRRPVDVGPIPQDVWDRRPGLEIVRAWLDDERFVSPIRRLTGWRLVEAADGAAAWAMPASEWFTTGFGTFYGGAVALLADGALNAAVTTTLPPGTSFATLDMKVNFLRPVTPDGRDLLARAEVVRRGRTIVVATASIDDADARTIALANASAMLLPDRPWAAAPGPPDA
jgi:uncharacterized protein (TIGR00369 family)